jgi:hypothetical protein
LKVVIDTNVLLVANQQHEDISEDCIIACIQILQKIESDGVVVLDDEHRILSEYLKKTVLTPPKRPGDVFLKWLLRNTGSPRNVEYVSLTEGPSDHFAEFSDVTLQKKFDPPDRKFVATACAHSEAPKILQAADCKWLDWWSGLHAMGVCVEFICVGDACRFYAKKFPGKTVPVRPS